jgi:hypothetical protein
MTEDRNVAWIADNVEDVTYTFAPTQVRGQRLIAGSTPPLGFLAFAVFAVVNFHIDRIPTAVFFFIVAFPLAVLTVYTWSNHLRTVRRAAQELSGVSFIMLGARRWTTGVQPHEGEEIAEGFVRILPGLLEIRTGEDATIAAEYASGQLERAVALRVMKGFMDPVARLAFADGITYDISVSHSGPRGLLPIRQRYVETFADAVRTALDPTRPLSTQ